MRRRVVIAVVLAAVAVASLWLWARSVETETAGGDKVPIVVAAEDIPQGTRVNRAHVAFRSFPESYVPQGALRKGEETEIIGHAVSEKVAQGQPFQYSQFNAVAAGGTGRLSAAIPKGQRALTLPVDLSGSMAGMLRPGDHVDIMGTFARNQGADYETVTLLQNVPVLATGDTRAGSADDTTAQPQGNRSFPSITVAVDLEEAELLVFAMQRGPVNIALRGADDIETEEQVPDKNFGDIFEAPKRANFARRHAAKIQALKPQ